MHDPGSDSVTAGRFERVRHELATRGQGHLLRWWRDLPETDRLTLLDEIESIPWPLVDGLMESHVRRSPPKIAPAELSPAPVFPKACDRSTISSCRVISANGTKSRDSIIVSSAA